MWATRFRIRQSVLTSLWLLPLLKRIARYGRRFAWPRRPKGAAGLIETIGRTHFYPTVEVAVAACSDVQAGATTRKPGVGSPPEMLRA